MILSGAVTLAAGSCDAEESLLETDLAVSVASRDRSSGPSLFERRCRRTRRRFHAGDFDLCCRSERGFFESQIQVVSKIGAALDTRPPRVRCTEYIAETEDITEDVAEISEHVRIETTEPPTCRAADARMPEAVVLCIASANHSIPSMLPRPP